MTQYEDQWRTDLWGYRKALGYSVERMAELLWIAPADLQEIEQGTKPATKKLAHRARTLWADYLEMEEEGGPIPRGWPSGPEKEKAFQDREE